MARKSIQKSNWQKKKIRKFFRFVIFLLLIFICLIIFVIKPGNPFGDIKIKDSDTFSKFETRRVTILAMKEFLSYPAKLNRLTEYTEQLKAAIEVVVATNQEVMNASAHKMENEIV